MNHKKLLPLLLVSLLWLTGCQTPAGPVAETPENGAATAEFNSRVYEDLSGEAGKVFRVDSDASTVHIFLWRGGPMAAKGHNHVLAVKQMRGAVYLPEDMLSNEARFDIVFPVKQIAVDPMPLREQIGGAFTGTGMTEKGARGTRQNMLGEKALNADRFPRIGLSSNRFYGEPPKLVLDTAVTIHGIQRRRLIPITLNVEKDRLTARGAFAVLQTDFGIEPFSAMAGALYLLDPLMVEFEIVARTGQTP
ncbi:MAG: YceI family protein [Desulfococcaceae bacterium]